MISGKNIVVGVTGGIAAYKSAYLTSMLKKLGANIDVCMTKSAIEFINPLTFEVLSNNPCTYDMFDRRKPWEVEHISLAKKANLMIIAPATANIIAKIANGIADDMLTTTVLATKAPVIIVPAMNTNMLENSATQENLSKLKSRGYFIMETDGGLLACGDEGKGRMKEPEEIVSYCEYVLSKKDLTGKKILVSAGPTREHIDPVRFLSNPSSGKMGYSIAQAAYNRGAKVTLVSGPVSINPPFGVDVKDVITVDEMANAMFNFYKEADAVIMSAAVSDYTPIEKHHNKLKKSGDISIDFTRTTDILKKLGENKKHQVIVGFAAETDDIEKNAIKKLEKKNLDFIALNDVSQKGVGFGYDTNHIYLFSKDGSKTDLGNDSKKALAHKLLDEIF